MAASSDPSAIAICGMALRLPGGIKSPSELWTFLMEGRDARQPIPSGRWNASGFDDSLGWTGGIRTKHGYFLDEDLSRTDASHFSMTRGEIEKCDPQQRILLEVVRECFEDAGEVNYRGQKIACYVGTSGEDWLRMSAYEPLHVGGNVMGGSSDLMLANRVSYEYDLKGPSLIVKTGCSSSLVALHDAYNAVRVGSATAAIVAGSALNIDPTHTALMTTEGILSPDGSCKPFDSKANGFARAEGVNAIYVKPLGAALRDGNPVRAIIRAIGSNNDGRSNGLAQPNGAAQEALMRDVYSAAGLDPAQTAFIECHGTGTPVGDPIEINAVGNVFKERGIMIGSLKANVGHAEPASGINAVAKAVLALQHKTIPQQIKFDIPNPKIAFEEKSLSVPTKSCPFPSDRALRVSVNSFGIGGSNAHAIIEAYDPQARSPERYTDKPEILLHSANTIWSVNQHITDHQHFVRNSHDVVSEYDLAYTLATRREHLPHRAFSIIDRGEIILTSTPSRVPSEALTVTMVFSGQGAQWAEMGQSLITRDQDIRDSLIKMDKTLQCLPHPPAWNIVGEILKPADSSDIDSAAKAQPLCAALQLAITDRLLALGITPSAVVGHSSGEICAAFAAGHLTMEEAITIAYYRGLVTRNTSGGSMAAVGLGSSALKPLLPRDVVVACENSPESSTISGPASSVADAEHAIRAEHPDVLFRKLRVNQAYHSPQMNEIGKTYIELMRAIPSRDQVIDGRRTHQAAFFSSVSGDLINADSIKEADYWCRNLTSKVKFNDAVLALLSKQKNTLFLEIGPASVLGGPLKQICAAASVRAPYLSSLERYKDSHVCFLHAIGTLFQYGIHMDLESLYPDARVLQDLPTYPWDRSASFWSESRMSKDRRTRPYPPHSLLGVRVPESSEDNAVWRNVLGLENEPWLADHRVGQAVIYPFTAYVAMAGEALRQISHGCAAYEVEQVSVQTALVIPQSDSVELVTHLRRRPLAGSVGSKWWHFTISSCKGGNWTSHCEGRVAALGDNSSTSLALKRDQSKLVRQVSRSYFYETLHTLGLNFGRDFQRMKDIRSSTSKKSAVACAQVMTLPSDPAGRYTCHPAVMDAAVQLLAVAKRTGLPRAMNPPLAPTIADCIRVWPSQSSLFEGNSMFIDIGEDSQNLVELTGDDTGHLQMAGVTLTPLSATASDDHQSDRHAGARITWLPDLTFLDDQTLIRGPSIPPREIRYLVEDYMLLCTLETAEDLEGLTPCQPHFSKYRDWLRSRVELARRGDMLLVKKSAEYAHMRSTDRRQRIDDLYRSITDLGAPLSVECTKRIYENARGIFVGDVDPLECLTEGQLLTRLYKDIAFDLSPFLTLLAHKKANLRILEVGAGTGGTTDSILRALNSGGQCPVYSTYTFTDISSGFFPAARERFSFAANMEYKIFDITQHPASQGLDLHSYDLIIACNVVHATPVLADALRNMHEMLKPDGQVIITELCSETKNATYIFGQLPTWWLGTETYREWDPFVSIPQWDEELKSAGFSGVEVTVQDDEAPYQVCATIVSNATPAPPSTDQDRRIALLSNASTTPWLERLTSSLHDRGWTVTPFRLGEKVPETGGLIACLDLETELVQNISQDDFTRLQDFIRQLQRRKLLWLTHPTQIDCSESGARTSASLGMLRSIRNELSLELYTLEVDAGGSDFADVTTKVFEHIQSDRDSSDLLPDREYVVLDGTIYVGRYQSFSVADEIAELSIAHVDTKPIAVCEKPGMIDSLCWKQVPAEPGLRDTEVEIDVRAVGLNFADLLRLLDVVQFADSRDQLIGFELAGIVKKTGSSIKHLRPGDSVVSFAPNGCLTSRVCVAGALATTIPQDLTFAQAATIPCCFVTVWIALVNVARLQKGQSVLIHSAAGGVGQAAIQICQLYEAEVHVTVGSVEKAQFLHEEYGIPRDRIYSSRDLSFVQAILARTDDRGVDVVLNSLSGDLLHASWKCVAPYGIMVELGKRDLQSNGQLDMKPFLCNRAYAGVDLLGYSKEKPVQTGELLQHLIQLCREERIRPLTRTEFGSDGLMSAFRHLQSREHVGKVVVSIEGADQCAGATTGLRQRLTLSSDATYLLTGGLGGLGRSVAIWLVEQGARHLTFLSRSAGRSEISSALERELNQMGCEVMMVTGKADNLADVQKAVKASRKPLRGVLHLAMVLEDVPYLEMSFEQWNAVIGPKVKGAWNLHYACQQQQLDFFWMASSVNTVFEQPGQANYAAGNTFLEAFARYRHSLRLPASVLNICPIDGVGYVAENARAKRIGLSMGVVLLGETEFLDCVHLGILLAKTQSNGQVTSPMQPLTAPMCTRGQVVMGLRPDRGLHDSSNHTVWRLDRRMGYYHNIREGSIQNKAERTDALQSLLIRANQDPKVLLLEESKILLAREIGKRIFDFMMIQDEEVDPQMRMKDFGLDSLMSIELRRWFRQLLGVQVSVLEILDAGSLYQLAESIVEEKVRERLATNAA